MFDDSLVRTEVKISRQDGIICTDGGGLSRLVDAHCTHPNLEQASAAAVQAGITQFLDRYREGVRGALQQGLLAEADLDQAIRRNFRVMLRLGLLDPAEQVPYAKVGGPGEEPWLRPEHQCQVRTATQKSIVLLKNTNARLPLDRNALQSIAVSHWPWE